MMPANSILQQELINGVGQSQVKDSSENHLKKRASSGSYTQVNKTASYSGATTVYGIEMAMTHSMKSSIGN
jgi:hypothetical protein